LKDGVEIPNVIFDNAVIRGIKPGCDRVKVRKGLRRKRGFHPLGTRSVFGERIDRLGLMFFEIVVAESVNGDKNYCRFEVFDRFLGIGRETKNKRQQTKPKCAEIDTGIFHKASGNSDLSSGIGEIHVPSPGALADASNIIVYILGTLTYAPRIIAYILGTLTDAPRIIAYILGILTDAPRIIAYISGA